MNRTFSLQQLVDFALEHAQIDWDVFSFGYLSFTYEGKVVPKQRPQFYKGKAVTPKETRDFEARVKKWGQKEAETFAAPLTFPIEVKLRCHVKLPAVANPEAWLACASYPQKFDADNAAKSICDGLNGVFWGDDSQIVSLHVVKTWANHDGFSLCMRRHGLNKHEFSDFLKVWRHTDGGQ